MKDWRTWAQRSIAVLLCAALSLPWLPTQSLAASLEAAPISHAFGYILANVGGVEPFEKIDLIVGGAEVTGDDGFVFTAADESALRVTDQGLQALKPGAHKVTVSKDGCADTELYVFAKQPDQEDYTVVDADFTQMSQLPDDWTLYSGIGDDGQPTGAYTTAVLDGTGLHLGGNSNPRVGLPAFLEGFSDYTIEAGYTGDQAELFFRTQDVAGMGNPAYCAGYITGAYGQTGVLVYPPASLCDGSSSFSVENNRVRVEANRTTGKLIEANVPVQLRVEVDGTEARLYASQDTIDPEDPEDLYVTADLGLYYTSAQTAQSQFAGKDYRYESGGICLRNSGGKGTYQYVRVTLPADGFPAGVKAPEPSQDRPVSYDFIGAHEADAWTVTDGGGSALQISKSDGVLTFDTDTGWPKADLSTSQAGLYAPKSLWDEIYFSYDFTAAGSARVDLWSGEYLMVLSELYGQTNSDGVVPGAYHGEISLSDLVRQATIYPREGDSFGEPLEDNSVLDAFYLDGVQVWAVQGGLTVRTLALTGSSLEPVPQTPTQTLYDALYPAPLWDAVSDSGYTVQVDEHAVSITNRRIDWSNNVGWPSAGAAVDWAIDINKTPYLYLDVVTDDILSENPSAKPGWNLVLTSKQNPSGVNLDKVFNAGSTSDAHGTQTVRVDLRDAALASLSRDGRMDLTGITLTAVTDQYRTVTFRQVYIAAAPKQGDLNTYTEPDRFGAENPNYRMPTTQVEPEVQPDYSINVSEGETLKGQVHWRYESQVGTSLELRLDGRPLQGTGIAQTPDFYMQTQGINTSSFVGPAVLVGGPDGQAAQFTLSSPSGSEWGSETIQLAAMPTPGPDGTVELLVCAGGPSTYFHLGQTVFGAENHNDPNLRSIRLTLPDGTVCAPVSVNKYLFSQKDSTSYAVQTAAYAEGTTYVVGDGWPAGNFSIPPVLGFVFDLSGADLTPVVRTMEYTVDTTALSDGSHTLELCDGGTVQKTVRFTVDNSAQRQAEAPRAQARTSRFQNGTVQASLTAVSPVGAPMEVSFFAAEALPVRGTVTGDDGEAAMTRQELAALTQGGALTTETTAAIPAHTFTVEVGDYTGDVALSWTGSTVQQERVRLSVLDPASGAWIPLATGTTALEASSVVNAQAYARGGEITVKAEPIYVGNGSDTMLWMSDTQHYTYFEDFVPIYTQVAQYTAAMYQNGEIGYAAHTGDLVEQNDLANWPIADAAHRIMDQAGVPMGVTAGNHDVGNHAAATGYESGDYANFQTYFGAWRYEDADWWGGSPNDNINHYDLITLGGYDFVMLYLGMGREASDETVAWANAVLAQYPNRNAVILTHEYLSYKGAYYVDTYGSGNMPVGQDIFEKIVVPNENVVLVLCGHESGAVTNVKQVGTRTVVEMLADYQTIDLSHSQQSTDNYWESNGDGFVRLLTFGADGLSFTTYSPTLDRYNAFHSSIDTGAVALELKAPSRALVTTAFSAVRLEGQQASQTVHATSGETVSCQLALQDGQGWYALLNDGTRQSYTPLSCAAASDAPSGGHTSTAQYTIRATAGTGGSISPNGSVRVNRGSNPSFSITADDGYVISQVLVDGQKVGTADTYTFENVRANHTIAVTFSAEAGTQTARFTDVSTDAWYAEAVDYVARSGIMNGTSDAAFSPDAALTRGMMAQILYNLERRPAADPACTFTDLPSGSWYADAVCWAASQGIVNGYSAERFGPEHPVTREQLAVMLFHYAAYKGYDTDKRGDLTAFQDSGAVSDWAKTAIAWANGEGLLSGKRGALLDPQGTATRAEVATLLMRFSEKLSQP